MIYYKASALWFGLFALAFVNGALREIGMKKALGINNHLAHQLSCLTGVLLWTGLALLLWNWLGLERMSQAIATGVCWFIATMLVETFLLNRNLSWAEILQTYNFMAGELWGLVLLWIGLMPVVLFTILRRS